MSEPVDLGLPSTPSAELPDRSRGSIVLIADNCTSCMACARECPAWCVHIESHQEKVAEFEGARPRAVNVLDRFAIDYSLCMYCSICIEVCPFEALEWSAEYSYAGGILSDLLHEKDRLAPGG